MSPLDSQNSKPGQTPELPDLRENISEGQLDDIQRVSESIFGANDGILGDLEAIAFADVEQEEPSDKTDESKSEEGTKPNPPSIPDLPDSISEEESGDILEKVQKIEKS